MDNRGVVERWAEAFAAGDWESMSEILHPDYVEVYPQSGELIRGYENWKAVVSNYPEMPHGEVIETRGGEPAKTSVISSPIGLPIIQISDESRSFTSESLIEYPNGERFHAIILGELKDGKVFKVTAYWAPPLEAPEWRAPFVESITDV